MDIEIRKIRSDEMGVWARIFATTLAEEWGPAEYTAWESYLDREHCLAAFDGEQLVGTAAAFGTELTVPGGSAVPAAAVTGIGVLATHRRRGIGRHLMRAQLHDIRDAGSTVAVLETSEAPIYERYGYGAASMHVIAAVETAYSAFVASAPQPGGTYMFGEGEAVAAYAHPLWEEYRAANPGQLHRTPGWWAYRLYDPPAWRGGGGPLQAVFHVGDDDHADGYALYRVVNRWEAGLPASEAMVLEVVTTDPAVYAGLWRFLLDLDLVRIVTGTNLRQDEPLRWLLADSRRLRTVEVRDGLWVRPIDLRLALAARSYPFDDTLVLEVRDPWIEHNDGRWRLHVIDGTADVESTHDEPDIRLDIATLGAIYLGGMRASTLAMSGRIEPASPDVLSRLDRLFASDRTPMSVTEF